MIMRNKCPGFTLIEALVTVTLSLLLSTMGLVVYKNYYEHRVVKLVAGDWAKEVSLLIKKNESASILREVTGCQGEFQGSQIRTSAAGSEYTLEVKCSDHNADVVTYRLDNLVNHQEVIFKDGVVLDILPLSRGLKQAVNVGFCFKTSDKCYYQVKVDKNGNLEVEPI